MIHKFDWELNLAGSYQLAQRVSMIVADGHGNLYTYIATDENIEFLVYELF